MGTVPDIAADNERAELDEQERAALNAAVSRAWASVQAGQGCSAAEVIEAIRKK
jgi:hypothetical protein